MNRIYLRKRDLLPISHFFCVGMFIQFHQKELEENDFSFVAKSC